MNTLVKETEMQNQKPNPHTGPILTRSSERPPTAAGAATTKPAPLRRWSVAELILQATLLGHPATARIASA